MKRIYESWLGRFQEDFDLIGCLAHSEIEKWGMLLKHSALSEAFSTSPIFQSDGMSSVRRILSQD